MNEQQFETFLQTAIAFAVDGEDHLIEDMFGVSNENLEVRTFQEACILTHNKGLTVRVGDDVFQVTIVKS